MVKASPRSRGGHKVIERRERVLNTICMLRRMARVDPGGMSCPSKAIRFASSMRRSTQRAVVDCRNRTAVQASFRRG
jgi:hypothetical protein